MDDREDSTSPEWGGPLVFAGGATVPGFKGSVYGALISGQIAAKSVHDYRGIARCK